jgi:hypothetical protein
MYCALSPLSLSDFMLYLDTGLFDACRTIVALTHVSSSRLQEALIWWGTDYHNPATVMTLLCAFHMQTCHWDWTAQYIPLGIHTTQPWSELARYGHVCPDGPCVRLFRSPLQKKKNEACCQLYVCRIVPMTVAENWVLRTCRKSLGIWNWCCLKLVLYNEKAWVSLNHGEIILK